MANSKKLPITATRLLSNAIHVFRILTAEGSLWHVMC